MESFTRTGKDIDDLDRERIPIKLSFNQIKQIIYTYRQYQATSIQGRISYLLTEFLRKYLLQRFQKGDISDDLLELIIENEEKDIETDKDSIDLQK